MNKRLSRLLGVDVAPRNEHEWDSAISILAVVRGLHAGDGRRDLHGNCRPIPMNAWCSRAGKKAA